jgi:hypothetical protein
VIAASRSLRESAESSIRTTRRELAGCGPSIPPQRLPAARNSRCRNTQRGNTRTTTARRWPKQQPGTASRAVRTRRRTVRRPDRPRHPPRGRAPPDARSTCAGLVVGLGLCPPILVSNTTAQGDQSVTPCNSPRYIPGRQPQDCQGARPDDSPIALGAGGRNHPVARAGPHPGFSSRPERWCASQRSARLPPAILQSRCPCG